MYKRQDTQTIATEGDYAAILPFNTSDARQKHTSVISDQGERYNITTGLMELSQNYFSTNNVAFKESQFLTYDILDASDYTTGLLAVSYTHLDVYKRQELTLEAPSTVVSLLIIASMICVCAFSRPCVPQEAVLRWRE